MPIKKITVYDENGRRIKDELITQLTQKPQKTSKEDSGKQ